MAEKLKVPLVKPPIGAIPKQKATVELPDNEAVRGMIWHVKHLVKVEEV